MKCLSVHGMRAGRWTLALWAMGMVWFAFPAASGAATVSAPSEASLSASVDRSTARVGDLLWLTLTADLPEGARIPDDPGISGVDALTIVEQVVVNGEIKIRFPVDRLVSFTIGPIGLTYVDAKGHTQHMESGPVAVTVVSNLGEKPEDAALRPIRDILPTVSAWMTYLPWIAAALVLMSMVLGWLWWSRRRSPGNGAAEPVEPPHLRAQMAMDRLVAGGLFEKGEVKAFYFDFSEIIRRYMAAIRNFPAAEMTVEEISRHVGGNPYDQSILPLLRQADLVKFADAVPSPDRKIRDVAAARAYIRQTGPMPAHVPAGRPHPEADR